MEPGLGPAAIAVPKGKRSFEQRLAVLPEGEEGKSLSPRVRLLIEDIRTQWLDLDKRIAAFDAEFVAFAKRNEDARPLATIPGIGALNATALTAAIGKGQAFEHGRDLSAWLGLVLRQPAAGGKPVLPGISKRGNKYLRKLVIHGARAALPHIAERGPAPGRRAKGLLARAHQNVAAAAWPTSSPGSSGRCCGAEKSSSPKERFRERLRPRRIRPAGA